MEELGNSWSYPEEYFVQEISYASDGSDYFEVRDICELWLIRVTSHLRTLINETEIVESWIKPHEIVKIKLDNKKNKLYNLGDQEKRIKDLIGKIWRKCKQTKWQRQKRKKKTKTEKKERDKKKEKDKQWKKRNFGSGRTERKLGAIHF